MVIRQVFIVGADLMGSGIAQVYTQSGINVINVNGSGISFGHPIAATGAMRLVTLLHEMKRRGAQYGLETICGGGGLGIAAVVERA
jgi:acetyl-CoA acetyltransferase